MGFLDDARAAEGVSAVQNRQQLPPELPASVRAVMRAALAVEHPHGLKTRAFRAQLAALLAAAGWTCRFRVRVDGRGTDDGYAGLLDLVAHPPAEPGALALPDPVLIEVDKVTIQRKTLAKLARFEGRTAGKVVILTRGAPPETPPGVDVVLSLA